MDAASTTAAIDEALRNAGLRSGDSGAVTASTMHVVEPDVQGASGFGVDADGDGD